MHIKYNTEIHTNITNNKSNNYILLNLHILLSYNIMLSTPDTTTVVKV